MSSNIQSRIDNLDKNNLTPEIQALIDDMNKMLKTPADNGDAPKQPPAKKQKQKKMVLKCAKGTRDFKPEQMAMRQKVFDEITRVFKNHGGTTIDTPVFELRELLLGNYGEDQKLVYNLEDQGGEILSLRYDLTVPFARFVSMNRVEQMKRYHIAKVYRRDQPAIERGRFREFYQCDFDIVGTYDTMAPDAEILKIVSEIIGSPILDLGDFTIKISDRKILDGLLTACGVTENQVRPACSAVDKLDKMCWEGVKEEMVKEKNIPEAVADMIGEYVQLSGTLSNPVEESEAYKLVEKLENDPRLQNKRMTEGLADMKKLLTYCSKFGLGKEVCFDLSLARGLDYYTGPIFETVLSGKNVGSVTGGGRYDEMVMKFSNSKRPTPMVGTSFGIERIMAIVENQQKSKKVKANETNVLVISPQKGTLPERMALLSKLWEANIGAETVPKNNVKMLNQLQKCEKEDIPLCVCIAGDEIERGVVKLRHVASRKEWEVPQEKMVEEVLKALEQDRNGEFVVEEYVE